MKNWRTTYLSSRENALLKQVRKAVRRGDLTDDGLAVLEGLRLLADAIAGGAAIETLLVAEDAAETAVNLAQQADRPVRIVEPRLFREIASTETSQGLVGLARPHRWRLDDLFEERRPIVVLDRVSDPGNAGTIVRSAEAFGLGGAIFGAGSASPFNPKTLRAAAGSLFRLPIARGLAGPAAIEACSRAGYALLQASAHDGRRADAVDYRASAIVIGSEAHGVAPEYRAVAAAVHIPTEKVESLNAAVAASILFYEAKRSADRK